MLHTLTAVQPDVHSTSVQSLRPEMDLSDLSPEALLRLRMSVNDFRSAGRRMVSELYVMTTQLTVMRDILGDRFRAFVEAELGLNTRMVNRYLQINNVLNTHFAVGGQVDLDTANHFTQRALTLLTPDTEATVVDNLREMARAGAQINEKVVIEVLSRAEEDAVAKLASTQAELTARTRELEAVRQAQEVERAKAQRESTSQAEMLRRRDQRIQDLEEDLQRLNKQATQVQYQDREVVPEGFTSLQEAIDAKTQELKALSSQRDEMQDSIESLNQKQQQIQQEVDQQNAAVEKFLAMKGQADALIAQFPLALLKSLSESDPTVKAAIASLGQTMVLLGQQLSKASV